MQKVDIQFPADDLVDLWDFARLVAKSICPSLRAAKGHTWLRHKLEPVPGTEFERRCDMTAQERQVLLRLLPGLPAQAGMSKDNRQRFLEAFRTHPERPAWTPIFVTEEEVTANAFEILQIQENYLQAFKREIEAGQIRAFDRQHLPETRVGKNTFIARDDALGFLKRHHLRVAENLNREPPVAALRRSSTAADSQPATAHRPARENPAVTDMVKTTMVVKGLSPSARVFSSPESQEPPPISTDRPSLPTAKRRAAEPVDQILEMGHVPLVILRRKQVQERTSLSRSAIYDRLDPHSPRHDPSFPKQIKLSANSIGWVESEIEHWLRARLSARK